MQDIQLYSLLFYIGGSLRISKTTSITMFQTFIQRMMIYSSFKYQNFHPRIAETNQWPLSATMMWRKKHLFLQMWYIQPFWACSVFGMQLTSGPYQFPLA